MASSSLHVHRARVASLSRSRPPDDPDLVEARLCMQQEVLVNTITRALQKAPPITSQVRERVIALISDVPTAPARDSDAASAYADRRSRMIINVQMADEARYAWAQGRRSTENVAVTTQNLVRRGGPDAKDDVETIHRDLMVFMELLHDATVAGFGPQANSQEEERRGYQRYNRYSDGTPVAILVRIAGGDADELSSLIFRDDIDDYWPIPPGWELVIAKPPQCRGVTEHLDSMRQLERMTAATADGRDADA